MDTMSYDIDTYGEPPDEAPESWADSWPEYESTHVSVGDGSPAQVVRQDQDTVMLRNENGDLWLDKADLWEPIDADADYRVLDEDYWKVAEFDQLFGSDR